MTTKTIRSPLSAFSWSLPIHPLRFQIQLDISMTVSGLSASFIRRKDSRRGLSHLKREPKRGYSGIQNLKCLIAAIEKGPASLSRYFIPFHSRVAGAVCCPLRDQSYFRYILFFAGRKLQ